MPKGKKGKGGKVEFLIDAASLAPYEVAPRDIIQTPLGVDATVLGVNKKDSLLWLQFPGGVTSPVPTKATSKADMEMFGYFRKKPWCHIQRSIDERELQLYNQRWYGKPGPRTADMKLKWPDPNKAFGAVIEQAAAGASKPSKPK